MGQRWGGILVAALCAGLFHCSAPAEADDEDTEGAIYGGSVDGDAAQSGAVVALRVGSVGKVELCSATLIAPNVLLTARHCVSKSIIPQVICNAKGESLNGDHFGDDYPVSEIRVYTGAKPDFSAPSAATVRTIVRPDGQIVCNKDIAALVLERPLAGVAPLSVRLSRQTSIQEQIRSVGYGANDTGATGTRIRKQGVVVQAVGPGLSHSETALGDNEFEVGLSICHGDSGGPAISQATGAVIGVVSRGGDCREDFGHVYTETAGFAPLINKAIEVAGTSLPQAEPDPVGPVAAPPQAPEAPPAAGGCSVAHDASHDAGAGSFALFAVAAFVAARRRRRA